MSEHDGPYPGGARFAFTIIDDTDVATRENVEPLYNLFHRLGLGATKTVWPLACPEGSKNFETSETLEDSEYLDFVRDLIRKGFEVTWHGATMESSTRERTLRGFERFRELLGFYPEIHVNHALNRENLYWGPKRVDLGVLQWAFTRASGRPLDHFQGEVEDSKYWWGDLAQEHIRYARNLTFNDINTLRCNPSMPYRDPNRPLVPRWFSGTHAEGVDEFNALISSANQQRLQEEGGVCIASTHLGKGFVVERQVHPETQRRLEELAGRPGWFPSAGELLGWLESRQDNPDLPKWEWFRMQWAWALALVRRRLS